MNNDFNGTKFPELISGAGLLSNISEYLEKVFDKGNIAVIFDNNVEGIAGEVMNGLVRGGYFVRSFAVCGERGVAEAAEQADVPDCVRYILGVGGGRIADIVRYKAIKSGIGYSLVATAPSTDSYAAGTVKHIDMGEAEERRPHIIFVDDEVIEGAPSRLVAAGYGRVAAQLVNIFDLEFRSMVLAEDYDGEAFAKLTDGIKAFEMKKHEPRFNIRLMKLLHKISRCNTRLNVYDTAADGLAYLLSEKIGGRTEGEASFIAAYIILHFYRAFLSTDAVDTLLPPDIVKTMKVLEKMRAVNYNRYMSSLCIFGREGYMRQCFVLNEYRRELFSKLDGLDLSALTRFWRRLYDDAGFWMKSYGGNYSLLRFLSLSAELSADGSLLKYLKRLGFLERFI